MTRDGESPDGAAGVAESGAGASTCPICTQPTLHEYRPFCSRRCADVDLNRWLSGAYAIPGRPLGEALDGGASPDEDAAPERLDRRGPIAYKP